jgi:hypothetical protein
LARLRRTLLLLENESQGFNAIQMMDDAVVETRIALQASSVTIEITLYAPEEFV